MMVLVVNVLEAAAVTWCATTTTTLGSALLALPSSSSSSFRRRRCCISSTQLNNKPPNNACLSRGAAVLQPKHNQLLYHHPHPYPEEEDDDDDDVFNGDHHTNNSNMDKDKKNTITNKTKNRKKKKKRKRVFFLDVNPICYHGSTPNLHSFAHWVSLFFSQVSVTHPVIAVIDGEGAHEYRRQMLPSYKAHRRKFSRWVAASRESAKAPVRRSHQLISDTLTKCNVPVVKIPAQEADDVVATLVEQVLQKGYHVVIASPDKDFKQLICEDVQLVMPLPELKRWSFYTLDHYIAQYKCDPLSDLSLRCIMGDEADGVPGIQHLVPGFGMKTALKLLKKHGSLENLLNAAAVRTVGKPYVQDALTKHACHLRRNYEVLSLRRDVNVRLQEDWLHERPAENDLEIISNFIDLLGRTHSSDR